MSDIDKIKDEIERRKKRWMYDDLPIAIGRYYEDRDILAFIDSLPEEKPSEDLEEAAQEYAIPFNDTTYGCEYSYKGFIAGAEWQKMKKATVKAEAEVCKLTDRVWITPTDEKRFHQDVYDNFKAGDNVEIIIVKEDDGQLHQTEKE